MIADRVSAHPRLQVRIADVHRLETIRAAINDASLASVGLMQSFQLAKR